MIRRMTAKITNEIRMLIAINAQRKGFVSSPRFL